MTKAKAPASGNTLQSCVEIFVAGIDGSGKSTLRDALAMGLERDHRVLIQRGDKYFLFFKGSTQELPDRAIVRQITQTKRKLEGSVLKPFLLPLSFLSQAMQHRSLKRHIHPDIIIHETDRVLHPLAYSALHFPFLAKIPRSFRVSIMHRLFVPRGDAYTFYLRVNPKAALERIDKRGIRLQAHENDNDLEFIKSEFRYLIPIVTSRGIDVTSIDTNGKSVDDVRDEILQIIRDKLATVRSPLS